MISAPGRYSYIFDDRGYDLSPSGREIDVTAEFAKSLTNGLRFNVSGMMMSEPGHTKGAALGYAGLAGLKLAF